MLVRYQVTPVEIAAEPVDPARGLPAAKMGDGAGNQDPPAIQARLSCYVAGYTDSMSRALTPPSTSSVVPVT